MIKYISLIFLFLCQTVYAGSPSVGLWEQFYIEGRVTDAGHHRIDLIFSNQPVDSGTVFSAVTDAGTKARILCCVRTQSATSMNLSEVFAKYKLASDDKAHLATIKGLTYIYEAEFVPESDWNRNMHNLVDSLSSADDQSPYSAALVSGDLRGIELSKKRFQVDGHDVIFNSIADSKRSLMRYNFQLDGLRVDFTESSFPD